MLLSDVTAKIEVDTGNSALDTWVWFCVWFFLGGGKWCCLFLRKQINVKYLIYSYQCLLLMNCSQMDVTFGLNNVSFFQTFKTCLFLNCLPAFEVHFKEAINNV